MTVLKNLTLRARPCCKLLSKAEAEEKARDDARPHRSAPTRRTRVPAMLSGGQKQRIAIVARADDAAGGHALRRADLRARPRDGRRGARPDALARRGRHDDGRRHARDGLRPRGRQPRASSWTAARSSRKTRRTNCSTIRRTPERKRSFPKCSDQTTPDAAASGVVCALWATNVRPLSF